MNILITGGAGFIGSHLSDYFLTEGHNVTIIDDLSSGKSENLSKKSKVILGDISDIDLLEKAFSNIDICYHLAAIPSVQKSISHWALCNKTNLTATINIFLQASKQKIPVIYASSAAIYGSSSQMSLTEGTLVKPISPYGADKYSCELQASIFGHVHGLKTIGLRFFNIYGPRQDPNSPYSGVISIFMNNINNNKPLNVYGDGTQERDFIFIDDVVKCLILAKDKVSDGAQIYNVCTGTGVQINQLIETLFTIFSKEVPVNYLDSREGDIHKSIGNARKAKDEIGFEALTDLYTGLKLLSKKL